MAYKDDRWAEPVNKVQPEELAKKMRQAHDRVRELFPPHTGVMIMTFDFGEGGGVGYICNGNRSDMMKLMEEWIEHQRKLT
jgi:hypothetical protein